MSSLHDSTAHASQADDAALVQTRTCCLTVPAMAHSPVSCGGCHPERLTAGLNASSGGSASLASVHTKWCANSRERAAPSSRKRLRSRTRLPSRGLTRAVRWRLVAHTAALACLLLHQQLGDVLRAHWGHQTLIRELSKMYHTPQEGVLCRQVTRCSGR